ncbi:MAG TPA: hypothetical protein PLY66_11380 [Acidobacteriota bacterium]|nr:hypothetical protein [Acidobacteriota bacterium]HQF88430.1 hypothetical protein [Acidobacteriota bacterium]HQG92841.1 hypothetical protein [Acidobacteriota bacterium]HQK89147.1 hypothetical protein [Acidobacteriota bacterium]
MSMIMINQPAGGRYRERQRAAPGASRHGRPVPRRHSITVAAAQRMYRGVSFSIAGDGWIVYRTGIQEAQTEWLDAWGNAWRGVLRTARCRSRYLHVANRWIVRMFQALGRSMNDWLDELIPDTLNQWVPATPGWKLQARLR